MKTKNENIIWTIFLVLVCIFSFSLHANFGDDTHYTAILENENLIEFTIRHYNTWSARNIVEALVVVLGALPFIIFKTLNIIITFFFAKSILDICDIKNNSMTIMLSLILICSYTWIDLYSAGWFTTLTIMFWPLAIGVICLSLVIKNVVYKKTLTNIEIVISCIGIIYAGNLEIVGAFLLIVYLGIMAYEFIDSKKASKIVFIHLIIIFLNLIYILTVPGNQRRSEFTISGFYLDYNMNSIFDNIFSGVYRALQSSFLSLNISVILLMISIFFAIIVKYNKSAERLIYSTFSLILLLIVLILNNSIYIPSISNFFESNAVVNVSNMNSIMPYFSFIFLCFIMLGIISGVYVALGHNYKSFLALLILISGFASAVALGLTPSIAVSGARAYVTFEFSMIIAGVFILGDIYPKLNKSKKYILNIIFIIGFIISSAILVQGFMYPPYV